MTKKKVIKTTKVKKQSYMEQYLECVKAHEKFASAIEIIEAQEKRKANGRSILA